MFHQRLSKTIATDEQTRCAVDQQINEYNTCRLSPTHSVFVRPSTHSVPSVYRPTACLSIPRTLRVRTPLDPIRIRSFFAPPRVRSFFDLLSVRPSIDPLPIRPSLLTCSESSIPLDPLRVCPSPLGPLRLRPSLSTDHSVKRPSISTHSVSALLPFNPLRFRSFLCNHFAFAPPLSSHTESVPSSRPTP